MHNLQFLPVEVQTSIAELRTFAVPDETIARLVDRILKASEAKVTSLQMDITRIEESLERRVDLIGQKLQADLRTQHGETNGMLIEVRGAQLLAHPQITELRDAFVHSSEFAAAERARLEAKIDEVIERVTVIEEILELKPKANGGGNG